MMDEQAFKALIRKFASNGGEVLDVVLCTVVPGSVDTDNWLCSATPISGDNAVVLNGENATADLLNVQLTAQKASNGFVPIPADGSQILVLTTVRLQSYIIMTSELAGFVIYQDNGSGGYTQFLFGATTVPGSSIQFNDGSYGGIPINSKILTNENAILTYVNAQMNIIATALNTISGGAGAPILSEIANTPTMEDTENTLIVHGK